MVVFLDSWMIVADFRHSGMKDWDSNAFKISVKALDSWSELSEDPPGRYVWSGFLGFTALNLYTVTEHITWQTTTQMC